MFARVIGLLGILAVATAAASSRELPAHPRLILNSTRLETVKQFVQTDPHAQLYYQQLLLQGDYVLSKPPVVRPPENASAILTQARAVLQRVYVTALLYRLTGNETYAARTVLELVNCTSWIDWNILKHALDTGELCHATAIGFDWTYDYLSQPAQATQKQAIIDGMVNLGMVPFQRAYNDSTNSEYWWVSDVSNWCVVTNSGAGMAALALIGENNVPTWVESQILPTAIAGVTASATRPVDVSDGFGSGYEDDGVWWEGPIYHGYASRYFVPFVWSLLSATGGDAGLLAAPGVNYTAFYQSHAMDAAYQYFNWADAEAGQETLAMLLGIADKNGDGASAFTLRSRLEASPPPPNDVDNGANQMEWANALMYYTPIGTQSDRDAWALDSAFPRKKLAFFRSSWSDPDATFVGLKAGNCSWNHGDQDSGQLVYSTNGVRWICDLGADNYDLPNYFGSPPERYKWYRKNSLGHNVLSFNGQRQSLNCTGTATNLQSFSSTDGQVIAAPSDQPLIPCSSTPGQDACASIDLTSVYSDPEDGVSRVSRSFYFRDGRTSLTVSDRWTASAAGSIVNVTSNFHTMAQVNISSDGLSAVLTSTACVSPSTCTVTVSVAPSSPCAAGTDVRVEAVQVRLAAPQDPSEGLTRVQFVIGPSAATCAGLDIIIAPGTA